MVRKLDPTGPIPFRPLARDEIVDKLDRVPVFAVVNEDEQLYLQKEGDTSEMVAKFFIDPTEAVAQLQAIKLAMRAEVQLQASGLGSIFAIAVWDQNTQMRIVPSKQQYEMVKEVLAKAPPLPSTAPKLIGPPVPLFGADQLWFQDPVTNTQRIPMFLQKSDVDAAWAGLMAAANDEAPTPPVSSQVQLTDLSTLVFRMEEDTSIDYRTVEILASDAAITLVRQLASEAAAKASTKRTTEDSEEGKMTKTEVLDSIFPSDTRLSNMNK